MKAQNGGRGMSDDAVKSFVKFATTVAMNSTVLPTALSIDTYLDMYFLATSLWVIGSTLGKFALSGLARGLFYALTITERLPVQRAFEFEKLGSSSYLVDQRCGMVSHPQHCSMPNTTALNVNVVCNIQVTAFHLETLT